MVGSHKNTIVSKYAKHVKDLDYRANRIVCFPHSFDSYGNVIGDDIDYDSIDTTTGEQTKVRTDSKGSVSLEVVEQKLKKGLEPSQSSQLTSEDFIKNLNHWVKEFKARFESDKFSGDELNDIESTLAHVIGYMNSPSTLASMETTETDTAELIAA